MNPSTTTIGADQDLETRVTAALYHHHGIPMSRIRVSADGGTVTLRGTVTSYYQRQLCLECGRRVAGVLKLIDQIQVVDP